MDASRIRRGFDEDSTRIRRGFDEDSTAKSRPHRGVLGARYFTPTLLDVD
ncbi:MAG: hypothetical protein ACI9EF_001679, partial [Pseudohongiellaceae bacterium]